MNKRILGNTGIAVSEVAFGGVEIGLPYGFGVTDESDMLSEKEAIYLIHAAIDAGINFFDTARMYGNSEVIMGKAFKERRGEVVISTKCRHFRKPDGTLPPAKELHDSIVLSVRESLQALQTSYVDVYMLHQSDLEILSHPHIIEVFTNLKNEGIVRSIGASTYNLQEAGMVIDSGIWEVMQIPFNLMDQSHSALFARAADAGIGITVRSVLMRGLLTSRSHELHPALKDVQDHIKKYGAFLNESITDLPGLALKFALSYKEISSVLLGMDRMDYLQKSLIAADGNYMDQGFLHKIQQLAYPEPAFLNLHQWEKAGWL